ncbi:MAG: hypothetical protein AAB426_04500 [Myxococcota bacterium]
MSSTPPANRAAVDAAYRAAIQTTERYASLLEQSASPSPTPGGARGTITVLPVLQSGVGAVSEALEGIARLEDQPGPAPTPVYFRDVVLAAEKLMLVVERHPGLPADIGARLRAVAGAEAAMAFERSWTTMVAAAGVVWGWDFD